VKALREQFSAWGKLKLTILLARQGYQLSASRVGRILAYLKRSGQRVVPQAAECAAGRLAGSGYCGGSVISSHPSSGGDGGGTITLSADSAWSGLGRITRRPSRWPRKPAHQLNVPEERMT
jgi:hypothetical protein